MRFVVFVRCCCLHVPRGVGKGKLGIAREINRSPWGEIILLKGGLNKLVHISLRYIHEGGGEAGIQHFLEVALANLTITIGVINFEEQTLLLVVGDATGLVLINSKANNEFGKIDTATAVAVEHSEEALDENRVTRSEHHLAELLAVNKVVVTLRRRELLEVNEHIVELLTREGGNLSELAAGGGIHLVGLKWGKNWYRRKGKKRSNLKAS